MNCREVYETGLLYHHYANTAYPLTPGSLMQYKLKDEAEIRSFVTEEWRSAPELSLYIHIPFCKSRCKFCEYVVMEHSDCAAEDEYVDLLLREMEMYAEIIGDKPIIGYDLGGGTPTKLSVENLTRITDAVNRLFNIKEGVVFSIETTPLIAAEEPEKIRAVYDMGYRRISMGVQTVSEKLLSELGRDGSKSIYEKAVEHIHAAGFTRFNIDLMYGFLHQSEADFDNTLHYAIALNPEYITLYRNRYKGTKIESEAGGVSIYKAMYQYRIAYRTLTENGYQANMGKNTFSRLKGDYGTSDYLTTRVINGTPYVGIGLGAQSFGMNYLAYNLGAADKKMERYREAILSNKLPLQDIYRLPMEETAAKMLSVAFYFAFIDLDAFRSRFGITLEEMYPDEVAFVLEQQLMEQIGSRLYLTERGSDYINGVIPLFYSERSKEELKTAFAKKNRSEKSDEELFLSAYDIRQYDRPSVAADIAVFTIRSEEENSYRREPRPTLSLLLIRRGEHPFMNCWALPGGFMRPQETIEECAYREITEETNLTPVALMSVGVFSQPDRDPRGRILSHAFLSIAGGDTTQILSGDDAIDARWFDVSFTEDDDKGCVLTLSGGDITLRAVLQKKQNRFGKTEFDIRESGGLAFDHAKIITAALDTLKQSAGDYDLIFGFLPETFTLTELQRVQETVMNITLQAPNFRRKIANLVEETDAYTSGAGHRPAKLFRRKNNGG